MLMELRLPNFARISKQKPLHCFDGDGHPRLGILLAVTPLIIKRATSSKFWGDWSDFMFVKE